MDKSNKTQLKRLIRRYEYLLEDWSEVEEIAKIANQGMSAELHKSMPPEIKPSDFEIDEEEDEPIIKTEGDQALKKLFRKIVVKCHPDRMPTDISDSRRLELMSLYDKVIVAHDEENWALMVIIAIKLGVELPEEAEDKLEEIEQKTNELETKIQATTSSMAWQWYHALKEEQDKIIESYLSIIQKRKVTAIPKESKLILGIGHPRTGTGYTARLLRLWGLEVGHETMGEDGIVAWQLGDMKNPNPIFLEEGLNYNSYEWLNVIYCVRDPRESLASIAYTETKTLEYRSKHAGFRLVDNPLEMAIQSLLKWDEMCLKLRPGFIYRIEDQAKELFDELKEHVDIKWVSFNKKVNAEEHDTFDRLISDWTVSNRLKRKMNEYCSKYGYEPLFQGV